MSSPPQHPDRALPIGAPAESPSSRELPSEDDIRALVHEFYDAARRDEMLGPIFTRHVADWTAHLPKMCDFWSAVVLQTGRYAGRPFEAHAALPGLSPRHFDRWLDLWRATVARVIPPGARDGFTVSASRMAGSMSSRLFGDAA